MRVSVIIPTYNEEQEIGKTLKSLKKRGKEQELEYIVVDGGSCDNTRQICMRGGVDRFLQSSVKSRASQMNLGAQHAQGEVLYFVHADTIPPSDFKEDIESVLKEGFGSGSYRFRFDSDHPLLKMNAFFTRFNKLAFRGGDQTFFITSSLFWELGGFNEDYIVMEDYELLGKVMEKGDFKVIQKDVLVSPRKYEMNGYFRVQMANFIAFRMFRKGAPPDRIKERYQKILHPRTKGYEREM